MNQEKSITFYGRFESDILAGKKTITIRNRLEPHYENGQTLKVYRYEDHVYFCTIQIDNITPINLELNQLNEDHARQENMTLDQLKVTLDQIYPNQSNLYAISFHLLEQ